MEKRILTRILRLIPEAIFTIDLYGRIIRWNKKYKELKVKYET